MDYRKQIVEAKTIVELYRIKSLIENRISVLGDRHFKSKPDLTVSVNELKGLLLFTDSEIKYRETLEKEINVTPENSREIHKGMIDREQHKFDFNWSETKRITDEIRNKIFSGEILTIHELKKLSALATKYELYLSYVIDEPLYFHFKEHREYSKKLKEFREKCIKDLQTAQKAIKDTIKWKKDEQSKNKPEIKKLTGLESNLSTEQAKELCKLLKGEYIAPETLETNFAAVFSNKPLPEGFITVKWVKKQTRNKEEFNKRAVFDLLKLAGVKLEKTDLPTINRLICGNLNHSNWNGNRGIKTESEAYPELEIIFSQL